MGPSKPEDKLVAIASLSENTTVGTYVSEGMSRITGRAPWQSVLVEGSCCEYAALQCRHELELNLNAPLVQIS
jgi:hypothetical protein